MRFPLAKAIVRARAPRTYAMRSYDNGRHSVRAVSRLISPKYPRFRGINRTKHPAVELNKRVRFLLPLGGPLNGGRGNVCPKTGTGWWGGGARAPSRHPCARPAP